MSLTLVAGEPFKKALESEVTRKGTFIESESRGALRLLNLKQEVKDCVSSLGTVRMLTASDLPSDQQELLEDPQQVQLTDDDNTFLVKLEALEGTRAEVLAVQVNTAPVTDQAYFTSISAFDGTARKAHCRLLWWDGSKYNRIKTGTPNDDLTAILPFANVLSYDKDTQSVAIALRKVQKVERQRTTTGTRSATRYRYEQQWNSTKYIIGGRYFGGYDTVAVPYTVDIPTEETEKWQELAKGLTWKVFAWDQEAKSLSESWSKWSEGMVAPSGLFKKPTKPQTAPKPAKALNRTTSTRNEPKDNAPLDISGADDWTDFDIQYHLTLLAVRHGYRPLKGFVRDLFAKNLGEDYQPVPGRSLATAESLMTRSEKSQYQRLARIRERRKSAGDWVSPW